MTLTLVATPGAADANTYATLPEADSYHEGHLYASSWTSATNATKNAALVMATRILDDQVAWEGFRMTVTQALDFPRGGLVTSDGVNVTDTEIPTPIKEATAEFARWLIDSNRTAEQGFEGIKYLQVESIKIVPGGPFQKKLVPSIVMSMIAEYGKRKGASKRLVRC